MSKLPIESIKVTRVAAKNGFNSQEPEETAFLFLEQYFDKQANKIKEIIWSEEGDEEQIIEYEYNENSQLITEKHHFLFDEIEETSSFSYINNLLVEKKTTYSYGSVEITKFAYNEHKMPTSIVVLDEDDSEEEKEVFEYEGKNLVHYIKHNALIGKDTELWIKYDDKGRMIEEKKWSQSNLKTYVNSYDYSKNENDPDVKVTNEKGAVIEAHIKYFNDKNQLVKHEIQHVNNGLKTLVTTYEYNDLDKVTFLETINQSGIKERSVIATYDDSGLLRSEIKSEYEVAIGTINTFTLNYEYSFHQ
jgi:hypothetical protein